MRAAHLVGSVPLTDADTVFRESAGRLGHRLHRFPDGETGPRSNWIEWQIPVLQSHPALEFQPPDPEHYRPLPNVRLRSAPDAEGLRFDDLGYERAARESWAVFARLQQQEVIPAGARFQVCLPTPLAPVGLFVAPDSQAAVEGPYEAAMLRELAGISAWVPHDRLAVQWDTAVEFGMLEGVFPAWFDAVEDGIVARLVRLGAAVPVGVELGFHLCYGDAGHRHFTEPRDAGKLVAVANRLATELGRPLDWIHLPVPRDRDDAGYYAPLRELRLDPQTELHLGLVHLTDGEEGTRRRAAAAARVVGDFGIATECGLGRRDPATVPELLDLHARVAGPAGHDPA